MMWRPCMGPRQREREADDRAPCLVVGHPQGPPVRLDDRTADGEPHPHAVLLGREEGLEDPVGVLDAGSGVAYLDADRAALVAARANLERAGSLVQALHRLDPVADQVDEHLLHLYAI